ncbi:hypothetical protein ACFYV7_35385 [Nocardia suismassiliense]|uniref:Uncharacterized protein n=1 Tax=Nocardia suismassiliense TaxID=2077092 RepID=A0ABW6R4V4_9NOCA
MASQSNNGRTVRVDPEALIDKGKKLAELPSLPNGLFEILAKLNNNLQSLGQPWGDDKMGKQFAEGDQGYLKSKDTLVGNASTGPDAKGAVPVYGQLLVNYGRTIEEAGKVFGNGDDLFAEWILKNYIDEDASGDPGPYKGPLSSDPNRNKDEKDEQNDGKNGPTGPPPPPPPPGGNQGSGGGPEIKSGGAPGPGALGSGPGPGGSNAGGPNIGDVTGPPVANLSSSGMTGPNTPHIPGPGPGPGNPKDLLGGISPNAKNFGLESGLAGGVPGLLGPNAYKPAIDPVTGAPVDKSGGQGGKGGGPGAPLSNPMLRSTSAFDGEKLAGKNGQGGPQTRAGMPGTGIPPGMPGGMPPGSGQGGASGDGKEKRRERRKSSPQVDEQSETPDPGDPWQRSGWRTGDR